MRLPRLRIPPPRDWVILGRPAGEWLYQAAMAASGVNSLRDAMAGAPANALEWSVFALQALLCVTALGAVVSIIAGRRIGLRLLWLWIGAAGAAAILATRGIAGAPMSDVALALVGVLLVGGAAVWYGRRRLHASITLRVWPEVIAEHQAAADAFATGISGLTFAQWTARPGPDSWSPAEITEHLARTYSQYAGESRGKNSLRIRLPLPLMLLARAFVKPRLLRGAPFPKAKAPRPLRPSGGPATSADGVALFRATGGACVRDLGILAERRPYRQLVHPYLGALPLYEIVMFAAQHVRHHHRQLLATLPAAPMERPNDLAP